MPNKHRYRLMRPRSSLVEQLLGEYPESVNVAIATAITLTGGEPLSPEVVDAIATLPQVSSGEWSRSYLVEQLLRNYLGLPADYEWSDLELIASKRIAE